MDLLKAEELLKEYDEHRNAIKVMIADLEKIKENVDRIIPTSLEARYIRFFEEKIKTVTALFSALLEMRKEIARSIKEEIEIRRKLDKADVSEYDLDDILNVRDLADRVDEFQKEKEKLRKEIKHKGLSDYKDIVIPGVTQERTEQ